MGACGRDPAGLRRAAEGCLGPPPKAGCAAPRRSEGHQDLQAGTVHVGGAGDRTEVVRRPAPREPMHLLMAGVGGESRGQLSGPGAQEAGSRWPLPGASLRVPSSVCFWLHERSRNCRLLLAPQRESPAQGSQVWQSAGASAGMFPVSCWPCCPWPSLRRAAPLP